MFIGHLSLFFTQMMFFYREFIVLKEEYSPFLHLIYLYFSFQLQTLLSYLVFSMSNTTAHQLKHVSDLIELLIPPINRVISLIHATLVWLINHLLMKHAIIDD